MSLLDHLQSLTLSTVTSVALGLAVLALVIYEPVSGRRSYARFRVQETAEGEAARVRFYRSWTWHGSVAAALAVALVLALPGIGLADIGFRLPDLAGVDRFGITGGDLTSSTIAGMITGVLLVSLAMIVVARRRTGKSADAAASSVPPEPPLGQMAAILPMLPRTRTGRRGWAMLSLSAGVTEEITYRGLLLLTLTVLLPGGTSQLTLVVVAAALFGIAHWYQGWTGVVATGLTGGVLAALYLSTGSLLVPMVLHTLIDLRVLLLPVPAPEEAPDASTTRDTARPPAVAPTPSPAPTQPTQA